MKGKADRKARQRHALTRAMFGGLRMIDANLDLHTIGVGRATNDGVRLPTYVKREKDRELELVLAEMSRTGGFALVVGPPRCGKTRFAAEGMLATVKGWEILVPTGAMNFVEVVESEHPLSGVVIWLDDFHGLLQSLIDDMPGRPGETINQLLYQSRDKPAIILATMASLGHSLVPLR